MLILYLYNMTTDISKIRVSLNNCEEVPLPYKFPYKCWIKYITIKGEDEAFYEGGQYVGMGDHKIFIINKGKRLVLIIDEFGKYLEYSSDDPKNGDVYVLQELAEIASRSNGLIKVINFIEIKVNL